MRITKNIFTLLLVASAMLAFAKNVTTKITVKGQCGDCKERIEQALDIQGVTFAEWNVETKELTVRYNDKKVTEDKIHQIISNLGYSTDKLAADKAAESKLPGCCQPKTKAKSCCSDKESCGK